MIESIGHSDKCQSLVRIQRIARYLSYKRDVFESGEARNQIVELE